MQRQISDCQSVDKVKKQNKTKTPQNPHKPLKNPSQTKTKPKPVELFLWRAFLLLFLSLGGFVVIAGFVCLKLTNTVKRTQRMI